MYKLSFEQSVFCAILWFIAFLIYSRGKNKPSRPRDNYIFFGMFLCFYSTFAFTSGDFYHYNELYDQLLRGGVYHSLEPFYLFLVDFLPHNYYLWRFVVWGFSVLFLILTFKRIKSPVRLSCLYFILVSIVDFSNLRNALGLEIMFFSLTFFWVPIKKRKLSYVIGILGLLFCIFFHKSMPLYIGISLLSFIGMRRWMYKVSFIAFPFLYMAFRYISSKILALDLGGGAFEATGIAYLESSKMIVTNMNGYISLIINRLPIFILLYYVVSNILSGKIENKVVIFFSQFTFWLIYLSCLFYNQPTSSDLTRRFWETCLYSLAFVFPLALYMKKERIVFIGYLLLVISNLYSILYSLYKV